MLNGHSHFQPVGIVTATLLIQVIWPGPKVAWSLDAGTNELSATSCIHQLPFCIVHEGRDRHRHTLKGARPLSFFPQILQASQYSIISVLRLFWLPDWTMYIWVTTTSAFMGKHQNSPCYHGKTRRHTQNLCYLATWRDKILQTKFEADLINKGYNLGYCGRIANLIK